MPVILEEAAVGSSTLLGLLRNRLRASGTVGLSNALGYQILDLVQKMFNARYHRVLTSKDITLDANTLLFDIRTKLTSPEGMSIVSITVASRTLIKLNNWRELFAYDRSWFTRTGTRHEVWAPIGADMFVVYPAKTTNTTATVIYAGETTTIDDSGDSFDIPTEDQDIVYDIAEAIFHLHLRNYKEFAVKMQEVQEDLGKGFPGTQL